MNQKPSALVCEDQYEVGSAVLTASTIYEPASNGPIHAQNDCVGRYTDDADHI